MDAISHIIARASRASKYCPAVGYCDPIYSIYGYRPSLPATVIFLALFAISGVGHLVQGVKYKTKFFALAMAWGCILEIIGYISKVLLWKDPYSNIGFKMSLIMLTLAPAFYSAGIYYTLKHICLTFGAQYSRIKLPLYTPVFISCDLLSIVLQALGGGLAASAEDQKMMDAGDHIMVAGLALQVFTLVVFGGLAADYGITVYKHRHHLNSSTREFRSSFKFRAFLAALTVAYLAILVRCAYRVAELAGGWSINNQILRNEGLFLGLDSTMCIIATLALNIFHPGRCLPDTRRLANDTEKQQRLVSHSDVSVQMQGK